MICLSSAIHVSGGQNCYSVVGSTMVKYVGRMLHLIDGAAMSPALHEFVGVVEGFIVHRCVEFCSWL